MAEAPGVTLQMLDHPTGEALRLLGEGAIDMAVDASFDVPDWVCSRTLFQSFIVSVAPKRHPMLAKAGVKPGCRIPPEHVLRHPAGADVDGRQPDRHHGSRARRARTAAAGGDDGAAFPGGGACDRARPACSATCRSTSRVRSRTLLDLDLYLPPYDPPITDVMLFWHRRVDGNAANAWLRDHIARALDFGPARDDGAAHPLTRPAGALVAAHQPGGRGWKNGGGGGGAIRSRS